jgi:hypothetical protein
VKPGPVLPHLDLRKEQRPPSSVVPSQGLALASHNLSP